MNKKIYMAADTASKLLEIVGHVVKQECDEGLDIDKINELAFQALGYVSEVISLCQSIKK